MKTKSIIALCCALSICVEVYAEGEHEVRRGQYPFMGFIYYSDETVVDSAGARFIRGAVLIRPDWLITSAITDGPERFPEKTLLAKFGTVNIDANFTLNEDEDEQEREVIQIVRPFNHSATQWWITDISLMKTLLPFTNSSAISFAAFNPKREYNEKNCIILIFSKKENFPEERVLMQFFVEMMPSTAINCGTYFHGYSMTCATDTDENKSVMDPNFCQGNSGGPLICEGDVIGIQTYIDNDCKSPHLYQLLSAWENFISCGTEDKCTDEVCSNTCDVISKDSPETLPRTTTSPATSELIEVNTEEPTLTTGVSEINAEQMDDLPAHETVTMTEEREQVDTSIVPTPTELINRSEIKSSSTEKIPDQTKSPQEETEKPSRKANILAKRSKSKSKTRPNSGLNNELCSQLLFLYITLYAVLA